MVKQTVAVIMGGRSSEREVSLVSGSAIARAIDRNKYNVMLVHIRQDGAWERTEGMYDQSHLARTLADATDPQRHRYHPYSDLSAVWDILSHTHIAFPVLHGPYGEDGTIQGLFETAGIPYVGGSVLFNSVCMHKPTLKSLLVQRAIPTPAFRIIHASAWTSDRTNECAALMAALGLPVFVKPSSLGSSIGISRVDGEAQLAPAVDVALRYGESTIVEQAVPNAREIECAVIGNEAPRASGHVGEIVPRNRFYDYESKYVYDSGLFVPARGLSDHEVQTIRQMAVAAYRAADGAGYARVDFLVGDEGPLVNEINTVPGFTEISMFPRLFMADGMTFAEIVDMLITLAWERFVRKTSA